MLEQRGESATPGAPELDHEKRRHTRHSVAWPAICFADGVDRFQALIVNVSEGGFGLTGPVLTLAADSILYVDFQQIGTFRCRVAWVHETRFGVEIIDDQTSDDTANVFSLADALHNVKRTRDKQQ